MVKKYVIDSSVLLYSADSIVSFPENIVIIPEVVIEEIRSFAQENSHLGDSARRAQILINHLTAGRKKSKMVRLLNRGFFKVEMNHYNQKLPYNWDPDEYDHKLLQVCLALQAMGDDVILISFDVLTRFKADILGIENQEFGIGLSLEFQDKEPSFRILESLTEVEAFLRRGYLNPERILNYSGNPVTTPRRWQVKQKMAWEKIKKSG